jgi:hypothetical protein
MDSTILIMFLDTAKLPSAERTEVLAGHEEERRMSEGGRH